MNVVEHIRKCDDYLNARTGKYEWREIRYKAALQVLKKLGLDNDCTVCDIGAGWTEFDFTLRTKGHSRCRYIPIDGCIDGVDLEQWRPPRQVEFFVALELLEHLEDPGRLVTAMQAKCSRAIVVSTPNPSTTDVLAMDATHRTPITDSTLYEWGFNVRTKSFYGQPQDSLLGVWQPFKS